jgi:hypothetical protein
VKPTTIKDWANKPAASAAPTPTKDRTWKQVERDRTREGGQFKKMNPCEVCGKGAGADFFTSDHHDKGLIGPLGHILCEKCATKIDAMTPAQAKEALEKKRVEQRAVAEKKAAEIPPKPTPTPASQAATAKIAQIRADLNSIAAKLAALKDRGITYDGPGTEWSELTNRENKLSDELRKQRAIVEKEWKAQKVGVDPKIVRAWARTG